MHSQHQNVTRMNVIGISGSGKSTLARQIADRLALKYIQLDQVYWGPNWSEPTDDAFFGRLRTEIEKAEGRWIIDGNYNRTVPIKWQKVQIVLWLDYPLSLILPRAFSRAVKRIASKKELWPNTGNRETFRKTFLSRDSVLLWTLTNYRALRKRYTRISSDPLYSHIHFVRLKSQSETDAFLNRLPQSRYLR